jgi:hypothetical protein
MLILPHNCQIPCSRPPASPVIYGTGISQEVGNGGQVCGDVEALGFPVQSLLLLLDSQEEFLYSQLLKKRFLITIKDNATS